MQLWVLLQHLASIWRESLRFILEAITSLHLHCSELMSVPDDLRIVLEQCLAEDATPENLEIYLPTVRSIITNLLQGLRGKQSIYRRVVSDTRRGSGEQGHERTDSRSSRGEKTRREPSQHRSQLSRNIADAERPTERDSMSRRSAQSTRKRDPTQRNGDEPFIGGFSPAMVEQPIPPVPDQNELPNPYEAQPHNKQRSIPSAIAPPPPPESLQQEPIPAVPAHVYNENGDSGSTPPTPSAIPASVRRYSLVDKPMSPPPVIIEPSTPDTPDIRNGPASSPPDTPPLDPPPLAMANSLAALKRTDMLERRSSKRYSTFNMSKMTGSTSRERSVRGNNTNRRSLAVSSALTPGELAVLTEVDDEEPAPTLRREGSGRLRRVPSRTRTPEGRPAPPVPPMPSTPQKVPEPPAMVESSSVAADQSQPSQIESPSKSGRITVFLQLGREVKKVTIEPELSFSSLRVLFVDRFSYNPGLENFPAIYIRDPSSGVQYELEDMDEVKEKCLLSLNIERTSFPAL